MSSATTQLVYSGAAAAVQELYSCTLDTSAGCWRWPPSVPLVTLCGRTLVDTDGSTRTTVSDFVSIQTLIRHPHHLLHTTQPPYSPKTPLKAPYISVRVYRFPLPVCGVCGQVAATSPVTHMAWLRLRGAVAAGPSTYHRHARTACTMLLP